MFLKGKRKAYDLTFLAKSAESIRNLLHAHMIVIPDAQVGVSCFLGIGDSPVDGYTIVADGPFSSEPPPSWIGSQAASLRLNSRRRSTMERLEADIARISSAQLELGRKHSERFNEIRDESGRRIAKIDLRPDRDRLLTCRRCNAA